jgi:hypothetical protein
MTDDGWDVYAGYPTYNLRGEDTAGDTCLIEATVEWLDTLNGGVGGWHWEAALNDDEGETVLRNSGRTHNAGDGKREAMAWLVANVKTAQHRAALAGAIGRADEVRP